MRTIRELVTTDRLERLGGGLIFERGQRYHDEGRVGPIRWLDGLSAIEADISGTRPYRTRLSIGKGGDLAAVCTCPMGEDGEFCKHAVALGLAWLDQVDDTEETAVEGDVGQPNPFEPPGLREVRAYLQAQPADALLELLMAEVERDPRLLERLLVDARTARLVVGSSEEAQATGDSVAAIKIVRSAIDRGTRIGGFVKYRDVPAVVERARDAMALIDRFESAGRYGDAIALTEHALKRVEGMIENVDDSDGLVGGLLADLQDRHLESCRAGRPDPVALARRLFRWEMTSEWDVFGGSAETYADVLGPNGLAEYRRLAEPAWADVRPLGRGDPLGVIETGRFRITHAMEALARALGDIDGLIAVRSADLSSPYAYIEVARTCLDHGRRDEALQWAEAGIDVWPEAADPRLHEFLADRHEEDGRHPEAMELVWATFAAQPRLERYQALRTHARRAGSWADWRARAMSLLRQHATPATPPEAGQSSDEPARRRHLVALPSRPPEPRRDGTHVVDVLLWEGDADAAWDAAREFGCSEFMWQRLARIRLETDPDASIPILRRDVDRLLRGAIPGKYPEAVDLIADIGRALKAAGRQWEFAAYLADLRAQHGRKRKLIAQLESVAVHSR